MSWSSSISSGARWRRSGKNRNRMHNHAIIIITLSIFCACANFATAYHLFPSGLANGDRELVFEDWTLGSQAIDLSGKVPLLGGGTVSRLWVNTNGVVSYNEMVHSDVDYLANNVVIAPFMATTKKTEAGGIFFRESSTDEMLIPGVMNELDHGCTVNVDGFAPTYALVVTWWELIAPSDSEQVNSFQLVLTTDGVRTFAIFHYQHPRGKAYSYSRNVAGIFAAGQALDRCFRPLHDAMSHQIWQLAETSSNSNINGQHVIELTHPLECHMFASPCGELPNCEMGRYLSFFENSNDNSFGWNFYLQYECSNGLEISPGVSTQRVACVYEPDYYEYAWDADLKRCMDLEATRRFQGSLSANLMDLNDAMTSQQLVDILQPEMAKLIRSSGISDVVTVVDDVRKILDKSQDPSVSVKPGTKVSINFTILIPTFIHRELTDALLKGRIEEQLSHPVTNAVNFQTVGVEDATDECLQGCLCRVRFGEGSPKCRGWQPMALQPDACCGGCYGTPYASSKKVCCSNHHVYDPTKSVCCDGRILRGLECPAT